MTTQLLRDKLAIPREHGFWAMLLTVLVSSLLRTPPSPGVVGVTLGIVVAAVALGGHFSALVRKRPVAQLASSVLLAFAGAPVELAGGASLSSAAATTSTWAILFVSSSLTVRSVFASTGRLGANPWRSRGLTSLAVLSCLFSSVAFYRLSLPAHTGALVLGALGCTLIAIWHPSIKQLKPVGIALASLIVCCGVVLVVWAQRPV